MKQSSGVTMSERKQVSFGAKHDGKLTCLNEGFYRVLCSWKGNIHQLLVASYQIM